MNKFIILIFFLFLNTNLFAEEIGDIIFLKSESYDENTTRIPFKLVDHLIVVDAELMGQNGNFIIDTGSETLILNKVHFNNNPRDKQKRGVTYGVTKQIDTPIERHLSKFTLQDFTLRHKNSDIIDLSHIEKSKKIKLLGVIGFNILKDYEVFIDLYLNQITLSKIDKKGNKLSNKVYLEKIVDSLDFQLNKHTIVVNTQINNKNLKFGLDTAAELNQIRKDVGKDILEHFYPFKKISLTGASGNTIQVEAGKLHRVKLSEKTYFGPMFTVLTNLKHIQQAFGMNLDGVLGYEFFRQKRTIINYRKQKLYFISYPIHRQ